MMGVIFVKYFKKIFLITILLLISLQAFSAYIEKYKRYDEYNDILTDSLKKNNYEENKKEVEKKLEDFDNNLKVINNDDIIIDEILLNKLKNFEGFSSLEIRNMDNDIIFGYNNYKYFIPASLTKLFTSYVTLEKHSKDFYFKTFLYSDYNISSNFTGNLYIKGMGDPVLKLEDVENMIKSIKSAGIKKIYGDFIIDFSLFNDEGFGRGWMWDDPQPQIASFNIHLSSHEVFKYKTNMEIKDYILFVISNLFDKYDIKFYGEFKFENFDKKNLNILYENNSDNLLNIIKEMLEKSDNQIAEMLFRYNGINNGISNIESSIKNNSKILSKVIDDDFIIYDGCGLSMYNLVTPNMVNEINVLLHKNFKDDYLKILASPYENSTIENRFNYSIWAKTGTLYSDSGISGIIKTKKNNYFYFTMIENNYVFDKYEVKKFENDILNYIYNNY
ncbi:MAG: hypothetical protein PWP28_365 [Oceanotoga sp.]|nr:hypothetical protein [Oceanotoga sp.]